MKTIVAIVSRLFTNHYSKLVRVRALIITNRILAGAAISGCRFFVLLLTIVCFVRCRNTPVYPDHPAWVDSVTDKFGQLQDARPEKAIGYLDSVYNATPERSIGDWWAKYRLLAGFYTGLHANAAKRWQYIDSMELLLKDKELQYKYQYAHTLFEKGGAYEADGKFNKAFESYFDGRDFAQQNLDGCSLGDFSNALGKICFNKAEYIKAIPYFKQTFEQVIACQPQTDVFYYRFLLPQGLLNSIGIAFERNGMADSAVLYYAKGLAFISQQRKNWPARQNFAQMAAGIIEGNLGGAFIMLGRWNDAETHLLNSISINDRDGFAIEDAQTAKAKLAGLYIRTGKLKQANATLDALWHEIDAKKGQSVAYGQVIQQWLQLKWQYAEAVHNIPLAYSYMVRSNAYTDSLRKVKEVFYKADVEDAFADRSRHYKQILLQKDGQVKTLLLLGSAIFLVMALALSFVTWYNLRRSKMHVRALQSANSKKKDVINALLQSEKRNAQLMRVVAHDLRNPIGAVVSAASFVTDNKDANVADEALWNLVKAAGENALKLVNDLLHAEVNELPKKPVNMADLMAYCADLLQHKIQQKGQVLELAVEPVTIPLHQDTFWRVMANLIANASKFSPRGAVIKVSAEAVGAGVLIAVEDHGIGIPASMQHKIFDEVATAQRQGTDGEESFGLGLAVSRQIVQDQGGKMWFESQEGEGTTFFIHLSRDGQMEDN